MISRQRPAFVLLGAVSLMASGCIVVGVGWSGPISWTASATEERPIDTAGLSALEVRTRNGSVTLAGQPAGTADASVTITKKAGGLTPADAEEALDAIEVFVERVGAGTQRMGWRWRGLKHPTWRAQVSFEIRAPGEINFRGETHNGPVIVSGLVGDVWIETHNGRVEVQSGAGKLYAETHNGRINATYAGDDITLVTHNGSVTADLTECAVIDGRITTHNGGVEVAVGEGASVKLTCHTHNGSIRCNAPLNDSHIERHRLTGRIGSGEGDLSVTTHNGGVRIRTAG